LFITVQGRELRARTWQGKFVFVPKSAAAGRRLQTEISIGFFGFFSSQKFSKFLKFFRGLA